MNTLEQKRNAPHILYRKKCEVLAIIDLLCRVSDFFYAITRLFPKTDYKTRGIADSHPAQSYSIIKVMDDRVYDFLLSPFLTLIYFIGFFLQVSSSIFLWKSCNKKSQPESELNACRVWSRIAFVSALIIIARFFLPYVLLSVFNVTYNTARVLFHFTGIYIVVKHSEEMETLLQFLDPEYGNFRTRADSSTASQSEELCHTQPFRKSSHTSSKVSGNTSEINLSFVRPRVHRAFLQLEKGMYDKALTELKIAQSYAPGDTNVAILVNAVEKMVDITSSRPNRNDYYKILGISRNLQLDEIKRAYKRKSLRHHPDKHFTAAEKVKARETKIFQEIREAYDTLSDPAKRLAYDERLERDQEILLEYKKLFKNVYISFDLQYTISSV